jgi:signal transduction histidine kinase
VIPAFFNIRALWALYPPALNPILATALVGLMIIPLALRRVFPSAVLVVTTIPIVVLQVFNIVEGNFMGIVAILAIFSAAAYGGNKRNVISILCIIAILGSLVYRLMFSGIAVLPGNAAIFNVTSLLSNLIIFLAIWWFGNTLRLSRERAAQLRESAAQLVQEREENARRAVIDERIRIVLAHHVSVMGILAGAARQVLKQYPEKALNALSMIETSSRQAVSELYRLLGLLRDENQVEKFTSQPGLKQLEKLISDMQSAGLQVDVEVEGEQREIPQMVDLSAYRIMEEALTNILKHAGATKAFINMKYQNGMLLLDITDNGQGTGSDSETASGGKGLIGMRERVNLLKGEFWAGDGPNGGFRVKVKLPLGEQR